MLAYRCKSGRGHRLFHHVGTQAFLFSMIFSVNMIYMVSTANLSPLQLVLVGTVLEGTIFIFEIPTGIVADVYSRRLSIVIGVLITGVSFLVMGLHLCADPALRSSSGALAIPSPAARHRLGRR
jgi:MFS family permease